MQTALLWAAGGTGFTFLMTTLGAASVFLFRKRNSMVFQRIFLGFAAGVMIAASVWSLSLIHICIGCYACRVACQRQNNLVPTEDFIRYEEHEVGT